MITKLKLKLKKLEADKTQLIKQMDSATATDLTRMFMRGQYIEIRDHINTIKSILETLEEGQQ